MSECDIDVDDENGVEIVVNENKSSKVIEGIIDDIMERVMREATPLQPQIDVQMEMQASGEEENILKDPHLMNFDRFTEIERKRLISVIGLVGVLVALSVLILMPVLSSIANDLNASDFEVSMTISAFTLVSGTFQLFTGPFSDKHGRKKWVLLGTLIHCITSILCALAWDIWFLIAMRVVQGMANSTMMIISTGIVSDIYPPERRGKAMNIALIGTSVGPVLGSLLGGILGTLLGWRSVFWFLAIVAGTIFLLYSLWLRETLHWNIAKNVVVNPFKPLIAVFSSKLMAMITAFAVVTFGHLFFAMVVLSLFLDSEYGYSDSFVIGLLLIPIGAGSLIGGLVGGILSHKASSHISIVIMGFPVGGWIILFGYLFQVNAHIVFVIIVGAFVGMFTIGSRVPLETFIVSSHPGAGSTSIAGLRSLSMIGAALSITFGIAMISLVGIFWSFFAFGITCFGIIVIVFILTRS